ncbi:hypothetical protein GCM10025882_04830 [Acinetobacter gyllenbergii]|uniref:Uncharacterized protein n=1 Tax=Acinetobacter gyllenbergii CIP 110306 = MTCC 11365 TaxID=1217657 RepID=A0A829HML6_9GAMM|nr:MULTISPECIES: hypothetical protein [Acinetobacter]EPF93201.1 hypothetical protein F957_00547 [Acinetobacter gyllenbergii CIP 110306 = MTCC 11365]ESK36875.1 hypothetical protein F987_03688 [Acinetobacter gyllenbergii NIPH 230]MCU4579811.1 hypothetical protein [Acinetobacter gyllenbergii]OBY74405.1 hypothetical protein NG55_11325 [Acinetobacter gyllenbergii]USA52230.1 hypothetical protein NDN13_12140 [Acinetobacter sp. C32I]
MEIPTWSFLVIAIIFAIVVGRAGTLLREFLESRQSQVAVIKRKRLKVSSIYHSPVNIDDERQSSIYQK